jgi:hypothetical protein
MRTSRLVSVLPRSFGLQHSLAATMIAAAVLITGAPLVASAATAQAAQPPASTSATPSEANASAKAAKTKAQVDVPGETTETQQVKANPDGTFTMSTSATPVRVKRDDKWVAIDTNLKPTKEGSLAPAATTEDVQFSGGGTAPLISLTVNGKRLSLSWPAPLPKPTVTGATALYPQVFPGVDLQITATADSYSEVLIVHDAKAAANPALKSIPLSVVGDGLSLTSGERGLSVRDNAGTELLRGPAPLMWDSHDAPKIGGTPSAIDPGSGKVDKLGIAVSAAKAPRSNGPSAVAISTLVITPPEHALSGPDVRYPLFIDPQLQGLNPQAWLVVSNGGTPEKIYKNPSWPMQVGLCLEAGCNNIGTARSYFQLGTGPLKQHAGHTAVIKSAYFYAVQIHQATACANTPATDLRDSSAGFDGNTAWPGPFGNYVDEQKLSAGDTCGGPKNIVFNANKAAGDAAGGNWDQITLALTAPNEGDGNQWKKFAPTDVHMDVTYNFPPNSPTNLHVAHTVNCNGTPTTPDVNPTLYATATDTNDAPLPLGLQYELWNGNATTEINANADLVATASGAEASWIDGTALADGLYAYRVKTTNLPADGADRLSSDWSPWYNFYARTVPRPQLPTVLSFDYPQNNWGAPQGTPGTFRLQANGAPNLVGFTYTFDGPGTEVIPSTTDCNYARTFDTHGGWVPNNGDIATITPPAGLTPGFHTLNIRSFDDAHRLSGESPTYSFYVSPNVGVTKTTLEAEDPNAVTISQPSGQNVQTITWKDANFFSGGAQVLFAGTAAHQSFDMSFNAPIEADYALGTELTKANDYGQFSITLDGATPLAHTDKTPIDGYSGPIIRSYQPLGAAHLTKGKHSLHVELTGTNPASTGNRYQIGVDHLIVAPINNVTAASMTDAMNNHGIGADDSTSLNLDFNGAGLSAQTLADAGLAPGATVSTGGTVFTMPAPNASTGNDNVIAAGQTIPLPASQQVKSTAIGLLVVSTCGTAPPTTGTVTYADQTHSNPFFPTAPDWIAGSTDSAMAVLDHWAGPGAGRNAKPKVYAIFAPTDPSKVATSVTLPNYGTSFLLGCGTLAVHVLAIATKPIATGWLGAWAAPADTAVPMTVGSNKTMRTVVHPTVLGPNVRVKLSNTGVPTPTTIDDVTIAAQSGTGAAATGTPVRLTFCLAAGKAAGCQDQGSFTMPGNGEVFSDPVPAPSLSSGGNFVVSVHNAGSMATAPVHNGTITNYIANGDVSGNADGTPFTAASLSPMYVTALSVSTTDPSRGTIAVLGDQRSAIGSNNGTWVDKLPGKLGANLPGTASNDSSVGSLPAAQWKLNDGSGSTAKDSDGANTAALIGGVTWSTDHNGSATFDGSSGRFKTGGPVIDTSGSYSISAWANLAAADSDRNVVAIGGTNTGCAYLQYSNAYHSWAFVSSSSDAVTPAAFPAAHGTSAPKVGSWTHLLAVYDAGAGSMTLYIDGVIQTAVLNPSAWKASGPLTIGAVSTANGAFGGFFNGSISDVRVYQRALTATDVALLVRSAPVEAGAVTTGNAIETLNRTVFDEPNLRTVIVALGSNDILAGKTPTEIERNFTALIGVNDPRGLENFKRADGSVVHTIITTVPPLGLSPSDPREIARQQLNTDIVNRYRDYFANDELDFDAAVRDSAHTSNINPQYLTNNVPNDAYYEKFAQTLADAVNDLPPDAQL